MIHLPNTAQASADLQWMNEDPTQPRMRSSDLDRPAPAQRCFIVQGPYCWGRGVTIRLALKHARLEWSSVYGKRALVIDAPVGAFVHEMGGVSYKDPKGDIAPPKVIGRMLMTMR